MTERSAAFTLGWYALLLVVVFTTAFWAGRAVGPEPVADPPGPPHATQDH